MVPLAREMGTGGGRRRISAFLIVTQEKVRRLVGSYRCANSGGLGQLAHKPEPDPRCKVVARHSEFLSNSY